MKMGRLAALRRRSRIGSDVRRPRALPSGVIFDRRQYTCSFRDSTCRTKSEAGSQRCCEFRLGARRAEARIPALVCAD